MTILFAPMEGLTGYIYRRIHRSFFPGVDRYYAPFISPAHDHSQPLRDWRELQPENNLGIPLVPQLLTNQAEDFLWGAAVLRDLGYHEVNLNLGCPSGTVVAKRKGAGFLSLPEELDGFLDKVFSSPLVGDVQISVKSRIGMKSAEEFHRLAGIFAQYPISLLILHPRLRTDQYNGSVHPEAFREALECCPFPLAWNGDVFTPEDLNRLCRRFPSTDIVMLGRGLAADPALAARCKGLPGWDACTRESLMEFHYALCEEYRAVLYGDTALCHRMKEFWSYLIRHFRNGQAYFKRICKAKSYAEYRLAAHAALEELELLPDAAWDSSII